MMKITNGAKVHALKNTKYGVRVDVALHDMRTTKDVYWSPRWEAPKSHGGMGGCNSYVVYERDDGVAVIASVNGSGEIRWTIEEREAVFAFHLELEHLNPAPWNGDWVEHLGVLRHFGVIVDVTS